MSQIDDLSAQIETYLEPDQVKKVRRAYLFGAKAHAGQRRLSGEPYIQHPLAVARILAGMHMDHQTLVAAILHDVIEDTATVKEKIGRQFGKGVAELVDGVSKLKQIEFDSYAEAQAHNFRKMLMAVAADIRVILVKLADRLHNMRTLGALPPKKRRLVARETLEIYAPIAQRLGMNSIRLELEELGFAALYPTRYRVLSEEVRKARGHRKEIVDNIKNALKRRLRQERLPAQVIGREKHLYGIYKKMQNKGLSFAEVFDVYAFRIIVDTVDTCYRVLGAVHNLYKPVPGKFKDYIAIPKANGYQSLHTVLFGPYGVSIEVQIRTKEMDDVGEAGIAAHWLYKSGDGDKTTAHIRAREWLRGILEMQKTAGNPEEFLENVKVDLFPDEVYVFTPKGDIIELPRGATAVDLAYTIHTGVGNTCVGARINRRLAPLSTPLSTGQTVEIITAPGARPNPAWLNFVVTAKARSTIRHYLKNLQRDEAIALGKRMLNLELKNFSVSFDEINPKQLETALEEFKLKDINELLEDVGLGKRMAPLVARHLVPSPRAQWKLPWKRTSRSTRALYIKGTEGMVVSFPKCCYPIPGDPILGFVSAGRGIVVHHQSCKNVAEYRKQPEKWVNVEWENRLDRDFPAAIRMNVTNQRGVLATVATAIADEGANIENVEMKDRDDRYVTLSFVIAVRDRQHLARVMHRIGGIKHVSGISRAKA
ncbi:MAG: bifunctional GTP diphosphokinase/guanosine-3',5'-bis pyrophosphate 3'-pyrophosphohydrolase [Gammaproteobacteria bacterium]|nr:bifunctional GTP diphosphokinase/guanosine-3',5'-bis pyrophosphate 3'-pyrophosphohydrolase [Gammaproteobacteria bacterium]MCI0590707.1 bifunctional GTP diphosphokinase/guanosine-3',5'-bis pyrophosphate 3'-pyrophosphohydrolase [Gammaproteobacteria bacterium]